MCSHRINTFQGYDGLPGYPGAPGYKGVKVSKHDVLYAMLFILHNDGIGEVLQIYTAWIKGSHIHLKHMQILMYMWVLYSLLGKARKTGVSRQRWKARTSSMLIIKYL